MGKQAQLAVSHRCDVFILLHHLNCLIVWHTGGDDGDLCCLFSHINSYECLFFLFKRHSAAISYMHVFFYVKPVSTCAVAVTKPGITPFTNFPSVLWEDSALFCFFFRSVHDATCLGPTGDESLCGTSLRTLSVVRQKPPESQTCRRLPAGCELASKTHPVITHAAAFNVKSLFSPLVISQRYPWVSIQWYYSTEVTNHIPGQREDQETKAGTNRSIKTSWWNIPAKQFQYNYSARMQSRLYSPKNCGYAYNKGQSTKLFGLLSRQNKTFYFLPRQTQPNECHRGLTFPMFNTLRLKY